MKVLRQCAAEAIATFALVFMGCGAIVVNSVHSGAVGHLGIAVSFGLVVMAMIYSVGNVSGAHLNPAVTIGFLVAKRIRPIHAAGYVVSQFAGACAGAGLLGVLLPGNGSLGATSPAGAAWESLVWEVVLSFFLMFVVLNVSTGHFEKGIMAGVAVGGTVCLAAMVGGPISGASMNPARSAGPALISGNIKHLWIYLVGPVAGAFLAPVTCQLIQGHECCERDVDPKPAREFQAPASDGTPAERCDD